MRYFGVKRIRTQENHFCKTGGYNRAMSVAAPQAVVPLPKPPDYNRIALDFRRPMPRPKVRGAVIDFHSHLLASRHAKVWFETGDHYGIDKFVTMSPLEEALGLQRDWPGRLAFIAIPRWQDAGANFVEDWLRRIEAFYNLGSRLVKFHMAPGMMVRHQWRLDSPALAPIFKEIAARRMGVMSHVGDPDLWYNGKYAADPAKFGRREEHYAMWESVLATHPRDLPWIGAHLGGNPENLMRLQRLLDLYANLYLDCSATRWLVREISARRDEARDFFIRNEDRIIFGSDQVSNDERGFDFLASRYWCHRKLWETAYVGDSPIYDPDLPDEHQPVMRGLALPDRTLQKIYHDNAQKVLAQVGAGF